MTSNESVEVTAATIDQAVNQALAQLKADQDDVTIEVLSTPRAGVLGLGARQARVRVTRRAPEGASSGVTSPPPAPPLVRQQPKAPPISPRPPDSRAEAVQAREVVEPLPPPVEKLASEIESEDEFEQIPAPEDETSARLAGDGSAQLASEATSLLREILDLMGESATIEPVGSTENLELNIKGDGSGLLIGRHGQTLDALEYVVNRILARKIKDAAPISVDTESYRARRRRQLHRMALSKGEQAKREHIAVTLDPMPPRDRRIVHLALKDDPLVTTRSSGEGFLRSIEIVPVQKHRDSSGRGRERRRERETGSARDYNPPGQQGGFKHGQKRIV